MLRRFSSHCFRFGVDCPALAIEFSRRAFLLPFSSMRPSVASPGRAGGSLSSSGSSDAIGKKRVRAKRAKREGNALVSSSIKLNLDLDLFLLRYKKSTSPAAAACAALESGALQLANHPTVGLYFVRDHVRSSLPSALATARFLETRECRERPGAAAHDAGAASEAVEMLRGAAPGAIERMEAALASAAASLAAIEKGRRGGRRKQRGQLFFFGSSPPPPTSGPGGAGPGALLSSLYEAATGGGKKQ